MADLYFSCCCYLPVTWPRVSLCSVRLLDDRHTFHCNDYFVLFFEFTPVQEFPLFLWISSNSCPLNSLFVRSHQAEIITLKRLIQERNNVTKVRVQPRSCDQGRSESDAFTHSAMLATTSSGNTAFDLTKPIAKPRKVISIFFQTIYFSWRSITSATGSFKPWGTPLFQLTPSSS